MDSLREPSRCAGNITLRSVLTNGFVTFMIEFAACAVNRTVTATWVCRKQRLAMNACMVLHARPEIEDLAREEWFAGREERLRAREREAQETEKRRQEVIAMMKKDEEKRAAAKATKSS